MSDKKKDKGPLDDVGDAFDNLLEEAQNGLREAGDELRGLLRDDQPEKSEPAARASDTAPRKRHEDPRPRDAVHESQECRELRRRLDSHPIHIMKASENSEALREAQADYERLRRQYRETCGGDLEERSYEQFWRPSETADGPMAPRRTQQPTGTEPYVGGELADHRQRRLQKDYRPRTPREVATDAKDVEAWQFSQRGSFYGSRPTANLALEGIQNAYQRAGRAVQGQDPSDVARLLTKKRRYKKGAQFLQQAFETGLGSPLPTTEPSPAPPSATPTPQPSATAKPSDSAPAAGSEALTGEDLATHREQRQSPAYDPRQEQQFNTDAKDLMEWQFQEKMAVRNSTEQKRATRKKDEILDRYRDLGRQANTRDEPAANYPRTNDLKYDKAVENLRDAYKQGFLEAQQD